jgi:hypothetical protein
MMSLIYEAIPAILSDVEAIAKNRHNKQQGFAFRGIDDVMNTLHPLFAKHKVFPTCEFSEMTRSERETKSGGTMFVVTMKAKYTLYASDGSSVSTSAVGEGQDSGDKATNKAMSACYKYAMFQLLCIPTEAVDADEETPEQVKPASGLKRDRERPPARQPEPTPEPDAVRKVQDDLQIVELLTKVKQHAGYPDALNRLKAEARTAYGGGNAYLREQITGKVVPAINAELAKLEPQPA